MLSKFQVKDFFRILIAVVSVSGFSNFSVITPDYFQYYPQIPLWDFLFNIDPNILMGLKVMLLVTATCFAANAFIAWTGSLSTLLMLAIIAINIKNILPFDFLPVFAFFAVTVEESIAKKRVSSNKSLWATEIIVVCSVYFFASFHKAFNFPAMLDGKYRLLTLFYNSYLNQACTGQNCFVIEFLFYAVIPTEFLLATLIFLKKTRRFGLMLAFIFHLSISLLTTIVLPGQMMALIEVYYISRFLDLTWRDLFVFIKERESLKLLVWLFTLIGLISLFLEKGLLSYDLRFAVLYFFLFFIPIFYYFCNSEMKPMETGVSKPVLLVSVLVLTFGFSPLLFNYSYISIGWTMFSGGHTRSPIYRLALQEVPAACEMPKSNQGFVIYVENLVEPKPYYISLRPNFLKYFDKYLKLICPELKTEISMDEERQGF